MSMKVQRVYAEHKHIPIVEKEFRAWLKALRSGKYDQTTGRLEDENGFCCLGVACNELIAAKSRDEDPYGYIVGKSPAHQPKAPLWLKQLPSDFYLRTTIPIAALNDSTTFGKERVCEELGVDGKIQSDYIKGNQYTFEEIAEILEAVYIDGVLEPEEAK